MAFQAHPRSLNSVPLSISDQKQPKSPTLHTDGQTTSVQLAETYCRSTSHTESTIYHATIYQSATCSGTVHSGQSQTAYSSISIPLAARTTNNSSWVEAVRGSGQGSSECSDAQQSLRASHTCVCVCGKAVDGRSLQVCTNSPAVGG